MLKELKFVQGAISQKDLLPIMTHFIIENGTVRGYNGTIALSSPIQFDINCKPKATPLVNAITKCKETISLSMTGAGKISIKSGAFKALVECTTDAMPVVEPDGELFTLDGEQILKAFHNLNVMESITGEYANYVTYTPFYWDIKQYLLTTLINVNKNMFVALILGCVNNSITPRDLRCLVKGDRSHFKGIGACESVPDKGIIELYCILQDCYDFDLTSLLLFDNCRRQIQNHIDNKPGKYTKAAIK